MTWFEIAAYAVILLGMGAAAYVVALRPSFWFGLAVEVIKAAWPYLIKIFRPASPEELKEIKAADDRAEGDRMNKGNARPFNRPKGW